MKTRALLLAFCSLVAICLVPSVSGEPYTVDSFEKIADGLGGIPNGTLDDNDLFGGATAALGDLDGDGVHDLAVGASWDDSANGVDNAGTNQGAVYILFLNADGTVKSRTKIADGFGGIPNGTLSADDSFGISCAPLGDLDGDDVPDLVVGAFTDDTSNGLGNGSNNGAIYVIFLNTNGTVKSFQKIADGVTGGLTGGTLADGDLFGGSCSVIGDLDGDGTTEIAVGAYTDDTADGGGGNQNGAVYVLSLDSDGTVESQLKIADGVNGLDASTLANGDWFGYSCGGVGDLNWDGIPDLAVGAIQDDTKDGGGGSRTGAIYLLFLDTDGTVQDQVKIADGLNGLTGGTLDDSFEFGSSCESLGDINGDGVNELAVGARGDKTQAGMTVSGSFGALYILFLNPDGSVASFEKIADGVNGFPGGALLGGGNQFGESCSLLGDLDGDGRIEVAVGSPGDGTKNGTAGTGGLDLGAVYILSLGEEAFTVTTALDELDATSADGTGVSLREAIRDATTDGNFRRIHFDPSLNGETITLGGTQIELLDTRVSIDASNLDEGLTISGNNASRIFRLDQTSSLELIGITIRDGSITSGGSPQNRGGGIQNLGILNLIDCQVEFNSALGDGGGIVTLLGTTRLTNSTVNNNTSTSGYGGGISDSGEGWYFNTTFTENEAALDGGALARIGSEVSHFFHVTIANNTANMRGGGLANIGASAASFSFRNTIVADNTATTSSDDILRGSGPMEINGENLIGSNESVTADFPASALVGTAGSPVSPELQSLADNGGKTETMLPLATSLAVDAASFLPLPATDQRGVARNDGMPDLGAVEFVPPAPVAVVDNSAAIAALQKKIRKLKKKLKNARKKKQVTRVKKFRKQIKKLTIQLRAL
ncbi:MAG: integrin alpha [Verrucomicrobiota bacterium]